MKKADLRKLPTISPTQTITTLAKRKSTGKNYYGKKFKGLYKYYLRLFVINGLIKVSIFNAEWVKTGKKTSQFDIFIDTEEFRYISLEKDKAGKELRWRSSMISNLLLYDWYGLEYENLIWSNIDTDRKINKALGKSGDAYKAINSYQAHILEEKNRKKEEAECAVYDKDMKPFKETSSAFKDWIRKKAIKDHFIFYKYKKHITKGFCSCCNDEVDISGMEIRNNHKDRCPKCKSRITFKSSGTIKTLRSDRAYVQMIQPYPGGYAIRYMDASMYYLRSEYWAPKIRVHEYRRSIHGDAAHKDYAWDRYKNKTYRWIPTLSQWWYDDAAVLYPRNLKYIPNAEMLKQITKEGQEISIGRWADRMTRGSIYEKLANAGFTKLLIQYISDYSKPECDDSTELHKALRIDKMRLKRLKAMNGGKRELDWLRTEKEQNTIWADEMISLFSDAAYSPRYFDFIDAYMTYPQIWEYLKKQYKAYGYTWDYTISCWRDYMNMAAKLKIPMIERNYKPKDVRIAHNEVLDMLQGKDIENEAKRIDRKWKKLKKVYPSLTKYEYKGKDYQIIAPKSTGDIVREGMILKHCVHTCDYYFDRISTSESFILFLRKAADPKQPYYTLEVEPSGNIRQKRTTGDRQNDDFKDAKEFLARWQRAIQKKLSKEDKALGKKSNALRIKELKELRKNGNRVWHGVLQGKLLADVLEADFMPVEEAQ